MNFITLPKSGCMAKTGPARLAPTPMWVLLELDQEILENWESPRDSLVLIQGVWEEKNRLETRLLLIHTTTNGTKTRQR